MDYAMGKLMICNLLLVGLIATLGAGPARGRQCASAAFPEQVQVEGHALMLNGLGLRQDLRRKNNVYQEELQRKVNIYVAALYLTKTSSDPNAILESNSPYQLTLRFAMHVVAKDITNAWDEGFETSAQGQLPAFEERIAMLDSWMTDVRAGQRLIFTFKPGAGVQVSVNGGVKGTIKGDDFGKALLSIWLGANPPNPELKTGLLGGVCG
jgi:hypothetical protein